MIWQRTTTRCSALCKPWFEGLEHCLPLPQPVCGDPAALPSGEVHLLPSCLGDASAAGPLDLVIPTGLGQARNVINVLSSDVVAICSAVGPGTASEAAHALKAGKPLFLLQTQEP